MSKLFVVPTPIGNLGDMTYRAVNVLNEVDLILAEDTRKSGILLNHYSISKPMQPYHMHNEHRTVIALVNRIQAGTSMAIITDAGTPSISDPGFLIVRTAIENGILVECLPGATAFVPALVVSGYPSEKFCFEGFLPQKKGRQKRLNELSQESRTLIFYESPYRIKKLIDELINTFGETRMVCVCREITKMYEETIRGTLLEVKEALHPREIKGEIVVVLSAM